MHRLALLLALSVLTACGSVYRDTDVPIASQADFQPDRYLGLWYEVARFPVFFEDGCTGVTAEYGAIDAETISVINTCYEDTPDGPADVIDGKATLTAPGQLKVKFSSVPFVAGDYWVLWVDDAYETAVVGVPSGKAGWILARTPEISAETRAKAEAVFTANGYDPAQLYNVPHAQ